MVVQRRDQDGVGAGVLGEVGGGQVGGTGWLQLVGGGHPGAAEQVGLALTRSLVWRRVTSQALARGRGLHPQLGGHWRAWEAGLGPSCSGSRGPGAGGKLAPCF